MAGSSLSLSSCSFTANSALFKGGALQALGTVQGQDSRLNGVGKTVVMVDSSVFIQNSATLGGGALALVTGTSASVSLSEFQGNSGDAGGALLVEDISSLAISDTLCRSNNAWLSGGCLSAADNASVTIQGSQFLSNWGGDQGGAIKLSGFSTLHMNGSFSEVYNNTALGGGGIWTELFSTAALTAVNFTNNTAEFFGGAMYLLHSTTTNTINCSFHSNSASLGGAVLLENSASLASGGDEYRGNSMHAIAVRGNASVLLSEDVLSGNQAGNMSGMGGALWVTESGTARLSGSTLSQNSAGVGGAVSSSLEASVLADNCTFFENIAASMGGAGYAADGSNFSARGCSFVENWAGDSGAGMAYLGSATGSVSGSQFLDNSASQLGAGIFIQRGPQGLDAQGLLAQESLPNPKHTKPTATKSKASQAPGLSTAAASDPSTSPLSSLLSQYQSINVTDNAFSNSTAEPGQGTAFFDASFFPGLRTNCTNCTAKQPSDTIGTLPTQLLLTWQGATSLPNTSQAFPIMADVNIPVVGLTATLFDSNGHLAQSGYDAVVEVQSDPRIRGFLEASPLNGSVVMPSFALAIGADTSANFSLNVTVSSPSAAFPSFASTIQVSFCDPGFYLNDTDYQCYICPIGSWCQTGQGAQFCPDGSYTFYPGQSSSDMCVSCPSATDPSQKNSLVLQCSQGSAVTLANWYLDNTTLNDTPAAYPCDISFGCMGTTYTGPSTAQCSQGYEESLICAACAEGYYKNLFTCHECGGASTDLFPLWATLLSLLWVVLAISSSSFLSLSSLIEQLQVLTLFGSLDLFYPEFINQIVLISSMFQFNPRLTGIACHFPTFNTFPTFFFFTLTVWATGALFFSLSYIVLRLWRIIRHKTATTQQQQLNSASQPIEHKAIRGILNWLDLCYLPVTLRCIQALYWLPFNDIQALGFAPSILWSSSTSRLLFFVSLPVLALYTCLWPLCMLAILVYAKHKKLLHAEQLRTCLGGQLTRYEKKYFWWHLVVFIRRIYYALIYVLLHNTPGLQLGLFIPAQVIRLGLQYAAAPFTAGSQDLLASCFCLAEILFIIAAIGQNFLFQTENVAMTMTIYILSMALFFGSFSLTFPYEAANRTVEYIRRVAVRKLWSEALEKKEAGRGEDGACSVANPQLVADWFRPHVLAPVLLSSRRAYEHELLMQVSGSYERAIASTTAAAASSGGSIVLGAPFGEVVWLKGFRKSQMFAALHQVVLAAAVKEKVVAEAPLLPEDIRFWAEQLRQTQAQHGVDLSMSRSLARFRRVQSRGLSSRMSLGLGHSLGRSMGRSMLRSMGRSRRDSAAEAAAQAFEEGEGSPPTHPTAGTDAAASAAVGDAPTSTGDHRRPSDGGFALGPSSSSSFYPRSISEGSEQDDVAQQSQTFGDALTPITTFTPAGLPTLPEDPANETDTAPAADAPRHAELAKASSGRTSGIPTMPRFQRSLSEDEQSEGPEAQGREELQTQLSSGGLEGTNSFALRGAVSLRERQADVKLTDEKPEELWPPPLENRATWVLRSKGDNMGSRGNEGGILAIGAEVEPQTEEWVEALLDSMGLSLAFQESFGQLTLVEKKNKPHALKRLLLSSHINNILGWLTCPACTMEDRKLFVDLIVAVREAALEEAGELTWGKLTWKLSQQWLRGATSR